jgi:hypothetical protein
MDKHISKSEDDRVYDSDSRYNSNSVNYIQAYTVTVAMMITAIRRGVAVDFTRPPSSAIDHCCSD